MEFPSFTCNFNRQQHASKQIYRYKTAPERKFKEQKKQENFALMRHRLSCISRYTALNKKRLDYDMNNARNSFP